MTGALGTVKPNNDIMYIKCFFTMYDVVLGFIEFYTLSLLNWKQIIVFCDVFHFTITFFHHISMLRCCLRLCCRFHEYFLRYIGVYLPLLQCNTCDHLPYCPCLFHILLLLLSLLLSLPWQALLLLWVTYSHELKPVLIAFDSRQ